MALVPCPECGADISTKAMACPICGHPIAREGGFLGSKRRLGVVALALALVGMVVVFIVRSYQQDGTHPEGIATTKVPGATPKLLSTIGLLPAPGQDCGVDGQVASFGHVSSATCAPLLPAALIDIRNEKLLLAWTSYQEDSDHHLEVFRKAQTHGKSESATLFDGRPGKYETYSEDGPAGSYEYRFFVGACGAGSEQVALKCGAMATVCEQINEADGSCAKWGATSPDDEIAELTHIVFSETRIPNSHAGKRKACPAISDLQPAIASGQCVELKALSQEPSLESVETGGIDARQKDEGSSGQNQMTREARVEDLRGEWCAGFQRDKGYKGNALMARVNFDGDRYEFRSIFMSGEFGPTNLLGREPAFSCGGEKLEVAHFNKDSVSGVAIGCSGMNGQGLILQDGGSKPQMLFGDEVVEASHHCSDYIKVPVDVSVLMKNSCRMLAVKQFFPLRPNAPDFCGSVLEPVRSSFERLCVDRAAGRYIDVTDDNSERFLQSLARPAAVLRDALPDQCK